MRREPDDPAESRRLAIEAWFIVALVTAGPVLWLVDKLR